MTENQINLFTIEDLYKLHDKQEPIDFTKKYDPLYFWDNAGDKYFKSFKKANELAKFTPWLVSAIKILKVKTLLDAGCGFARIEPFLLDSGVVEEVTGIDISQKQLDSATKYLEGYEKKDKIKLQKQTIKWSNTPPNSYDCVLSVECIQHMQLSSARYAIRELQKLTRKYAIIVERFVYDREHPFPHLWSHNYPKLVTDMGFKMLEGKVIDNGVIGLVLEK